MECGDGDAKKVVTKQTLRSCDCLCWHLLYCFFSTLLSQPRYDTLPKLSSSVKTSVSTMLLIFFLFWTLASHWDEKQAAVVFLASSPSSILFLYMGVALHWPTGPALPTWLSSPLFILAPFLEQQHLIPSSVQFGLSPLQPKLLLSHL